jgi:hypothetical protein
MNYHATKAQEKGGIARLFAPFVCGIVQRSMKEFLREQE